MNVPLKLTLLRILLTFVIMGLLFTTGWPAKLAALVGFLLASMTDWLDGYLARRWHQTTPLGALLDPIADKVLVLGMFLAFVQLRLIPAWMVLIIVLRELLITGVRLFAASRHVVLQAAKEGKHKTVSQIVTICVVLSMLVIREFVGYSSVPASMETTMQWAVLGCLWVTMIFTVISGTTFFWRHRVVLMDAVTQ